MDLDNIMKLNLDIVALLPAMLTASLAAAQPTTPEPDNAPLDVGQLFATTCGFCHSSGGRAAGKGPQLMYTQRSDDFIRNRIKNGKEGAMPAFGAVFTDAQIGDIIKYIRELKPREG
jgi:mono/diheme cytochrome c family protein